MSRAWALIGTMCAPFRLPHFMFRAGMVQSVIDLLKSFHCAGFVPSRFSDPTTFPMREAVRSVNKSAMAAVLVRKASERISATKRRTSFSASAGCGVPLSRPVDRTRSGKRSEASVGGAVQSGKDRLPGTRQRTWRCPDVFCVPSIHEALRRHCLEFVQRRR